VFLGGIASGTDAATLCIQCSRYGPVACAKVPQDPDGRPKSFAFVTFVHPEGAAAVKAAGHIELGGRVVDVKDAMRGRGAGGAGGGAGVVAMPLGRALAARLPNDLSYP
jgi:hypothetical protein